MTVKTLVDEWRSRKPEKAIVDEVIKQAWLVFLAVLGLLIHFARKYIPSMSAYLTPGLPWVVVVAFPIAVVIAIYYNFTSRGRKSRLHQLLRRLRQYKRFNHEKEMEVLSRIHSRTRAAALVFLMTLFLMLPLAIAISYLYGVALITDIVNNIKGTHSHPSFGPS